MMPELRLLTFGGLTLTRARVPLTGPASQRTRLALLAFLAASNDRGVSRDKVMGYLWPDSDTEHARGALKQSVYVLRSELGADDLIVGTTDLHLNREIIAADVTEFQDLFRRSDYERALEMYTGPFLDGVYLKNAPEFERWAAEQRTRLAGLAAQMSKQLAESATKAGDHSVAAKWWQWLLGMDPLSATAAAGAISALAQSDQPTAAREQFRAYQALLRDELGKAPEKTVLDALALVHAPTVHHDQPASIAAVAKEAGSSPAPVRNNERVPTLLTPQTSVRAGKGRDGWHGGRAVLFAGGVVALLAAALIGAIRTNNKPSMAERQIVVARFSNQTGDSTLDPIGALAADWITDELSRSGFVSVIDPATALRAVRSSGATNKSTSEPANISRELAAATGADVVVSGAYYKNGDSLRFVARVIDSKDDRVIGSISTVSVMSSDVMRGVESVRQRLLGVLAKEFDKRLAQFVDSASPPPTYTAYREYVIGYDLWLREEWTGALQHFKQAHALDTTFVTPLFHAALLYNWLGSGNNVLDKSKQDTARMLIEKISPSRDRLTPLNGYVLEALQAGMDRDLGAWFQALKAASELAPGSEWTWLAANETGTLNRPSLSLQILKQVNPDKRGAWGRVQYWVRTIRTRHVLGDFRGEAEAVDQLSHGSTRDNRIRQYYARVFALNGRFREVPALVDELLSSGERRTGERIRAVILDLERHGMHREAESLLPRVIAWYRSLGPKPDEHSRRHMGYMLSDLGHDEPARRQFASLRAGPHDSTFTVVYAGMLGVLAAKRGDIASATAISDSISRLPDYWSGTNNYFRARIAAQLTRKEEAVNLLRAAFAEGALQMDFDHTQRPNFPTLHGYAPFEALVRSDRPFVRGLKY